MEAVQIIFAPYNIICSLLQTGKQRLSPGRARDHPVMETVPNKALSLSLSLSLSLRLRLSVGLIRRSGSPVFVSPVGSPLENPGELKNLERVAPPGGMPWYSTWLWRILDVASRRQVLEGLVSESEVAGGMPWYATSWLCRGVL